MAKRKRSDMQLVCVGVLLGILAQGMYESSKEIIALIFEPPGIGLYMFVDVMVPIVASLLAYFVLKFLIFRAQSNSKLKTD
jgi:hypothetical protein